jgi:hypothetical protein
MDFWYCMGLNEHLKVCTGGTNQEVKYVENF